MDIASARAGAILVPTFEPPWCVQHCNTKQKIRIYRPIAPESILAVKVIIS